MQSITSSVVRILAVIAVSSVAVPGALAAFAAGGHDLPPSAIGDRQVFLNFNAPAIASLSDRIEMSYSFIDKATGDKIPHVTYYLTVTNPSGDKTFSEVLHGHDGTVNVEFRPSDQYVVNANYDNLAASYVPDQAGVIKVAGPVFAMEGNYRVGIEVNGIDFDNTFLQEPIKYGYALTVASVQEFSVSHEEEDFGIEVSSPIEVESVELKPESKQLVIQYPGGEWKHVDNFQVNVEFPDEMMSGPFTAVFNGMDLNVTESQSEGRTSLFLNGTHLDVMQMNQSGMEGMQMDGQQNAIVITATNVVPEFRIAMAVAAGAAMGAVIVARRKPRL